MARKKAARKAAVALRYKEGKDRAPLVLAKGRGLTAEKIQEAAEKAGVPLHRDEELVEALCQVELLKEIPQDLYAVVAEILAYVRRTSRRP